MTASKAAIVVDGIIRDISNRRRDEWLSIVRMSERLCDTCRYRGFRVCKLDKYCWFSTIEVTK